MSLPVRIVQAVGLRKRYGTAEVVRGIDFAVSKGECFGILGPNGAGKTTTLRMLLGHTPPSGGQLDVLGYSMPSGARAMHERVGLVPQHNNLDPDFTVTENLQVYAAYFAIQRDEVARRIPSLLQFAALESKAGAKIDELSGGMQRRLTLARALVNDPELLVLDEPTTGLDPQARHVIWQRLRQLRASGKTVVITTHYMEEAERLCDRLIVIDKGVILAQGAPKDLIHDLVEPYVVELFGAEERVWAEALTARAGLRLETLEESVLLYTHDELALLDLLRGQPQYRFTHRRANLEDVFLRLTGRELREA